MLPNNILSSPADLSLSNKKFNLLIDLFNNLFHKNSKITILINDPKIK